MAVRSAAGISLALPPRTPWSLGGFEGLPERPEDNEDEPDKRDRKQNHCLQPTQDLVAYFCTEGGGKRFPAPIRYFVLVILRVLEAGNVVLRD
jgi:hypothetical protein